MRRSTGCVFGVAFDRDVLDAKVSEAIVGHGVALSRLERRVFCEALAFDSVPQTARDAYGLPDPCATLEGLAVHPRPGLRAQHAAKSRRTRATPGWPVAKQDAQPPQNSNIVGSCKRICVIVAIISQLPNAANVRPVSMQVRRFTVVARPESR
jgi:hypothetical protein